MHHASWIKGATFFEIAVYHRSCHNIPTKAILFFFGCSEVNSTWLIVSEVKRSLSARAKSTIHVLLTLDILQEAQKLFTKRGLQFSNACQAVNGKKYEIFVCKLPIYNLTSDLTQ